LLIIISVLGLSVQDSESTGQVRAQPRKEEKAGERDAKGRGMGRGEG
jgi:hypothetical protein